MLHLREEGMPLDEMAVLFRSSYNSFELEVELGRRGIPFVKYGGLKLSEAAHVKDVAAYLRVAENVRDAVAWNRVLRLLPGVGPKTAAAITRLVTPHSDDALSDATAQSCPPRIREALPPLQDAHRGWAPSRSATRSNSRPVRADSREEARRRFSEAAPGPCPPRR